MFPVLFFKTNRRRGPFQAGEQGFVAIYRHHQGARRIGASGAFDGGEAFLRKEAREALPANHRRPHG